MTERVCPFGDGRHQRKPWHDREAGKSGLSCVRCHRTWAFVGKDLVPTWPDAEIGRSGL